MDRERERSLPVCCNCSDELERSEQIWHGGELYCDSCYGGLFCFCGGCGSTVLISRTYPSRAFDTLCEFCYRQRHTQCEECAAELDGDKSSYQGLHGKLYCRSCYRIKATQEVKCSSAELDGRYLEDCTINTILSYYAGLPFNDYKQRFPLRYSDARQVARYLCATASCELRHASKMVTAIPVQGEEVWNWFVKQNHINNNKPRATGSKMFLSLSHDWPLEKYLWFLRGAAYVFYGSWATSGYGGKKWASCCWYSADWLEEIIRDEGFASPITWERWLGACHNGGPWLNKVGTGRILYILNAAFLPGKDIAFSLIRNLHTLTELGSVLNWAREYPDEAMTVVAVIYQDYPTYRNPLLSALSAGSEPREGNAKFKIPGYPRDNPLITVGYAYG